MAKGAQLTVRIDAELKRQLELIAEVQDRSVAYIAEQMLADGVKAFQKAGAAAVKASRK